LPTSTRFAVAVHLLAALAVNPGRAMPSEQVAGSASTNPAVVRRLLSMLAAAGLTTSRLGQGGGALLARPPGDISLLEVYRAVEEPGLFAMHRSPPDPNCFVGRNIQPVLRPITDRAESALEAELASVTLADVAAEVLARAQADAH
jgi:Rrf2 family protein